MNKLDKFKKIGRLTILVDEENVTPHVFSFFHKSYVVVPKHVLNKKDFLKTAISHELQHIRNGDTHSIYLWQFFKCLLWINPFIHIILSYIKNLQELRVDENLIHEKKINYKVYLKTLSWFVSEGRQQPRYSLSHSIFGWSTFKELKMRISNIHRIRPMRSQPLYCLFFLAGNIFALLIIGNSSPKFQYSLNEIQRMYTPEYMKTEFVFKWSEPPFGPINPERTLEFGKTRQIATNTRFYSIEQPLNMDTSLLNKLKDVKINGLGSPYSIYSIHGDSLQIRNLNVDAKVVEYSDNSAVLRFDGFTYGDDIMISGKLTKDNILKLIESIAQSEIKIQETIQVRFNEKFEVNGIPGSFKIYKKLSPKNQISFFPKLPDLIAEEKTN